jgi:hypothetical protein
MKKLMTLVMVGLFSFNASAGWFSDTYHEQGYDRGLEVGFGWTACSRSGVGEQIHTVKWNLQAKEQLDYFIKGNKVDKKDYDEFESGYWKGTKLGKSKCDIK